MESSLLTGADVSLSGNRPKTGSDCVSDCCRCTCAFCLYFLWIPVFVFHIQKSWLGHLGTLGPTVPDQGTSAWFAPHTLSCLHLFNHTKLKFVFIQAYMQALTNRPVVCENKSLVVSIFVSPLVLCPDFEPAMTAVPLKQLQFS